MLSAASPSSRVAMESTGSVITCPSNRTSPANAASQSVVALLTMASRTGCTSVSDLEMIRRMSPVAVSRSSPSVSSRFRASSISRRRSFSRAMAAWSAKVRRSAICFAVNGRTRARQMMISPTTAPSRRSGVASSVRRSE